MKQPYTIDFQKIGSNSEGFLSISELSKSIPFQVKRIFWNYGTPVSITRGRHAHHNTEMVLIALNGSIELKTIDKNGEKKSFILRDPNTGVYLPSLCWHEMNYSLDALQLVLCSTEYNESDYIRSKEDFMKLIG